MARTQFDDAKKQEIVRLSQQKNADLNALAAQNGITKKDIYNWRSRFNHTNARPAARARKKAQTRRYTSADRAKVVELEQRLGSAYHRIHVLEQYILEKELGIKSQ